MSSTLLAVIVGSVVGGGWIALLIWTIRQILRDTKESDAARILWILVVVFLPFMGPLIWAFVRWQVPNYGRMQLR